MNLFLFLLEKKLNILEALLKILYKSIPSKIEVYLFEVLKNRRIKKKIYFYLSVVY